MIYERKKTLQLDLFLFGNFPISNSIKSLHSIHVDWIFWFNKANRIFFFRHANYYIIILTTFLNRKQYKCLNSDVFKKKSIEFFFREIFSLLQIFCRCFLRRIFMVLINIYVRKIVIRKFICFLIKFWEIVSDAINL